MRTPLVPLIFNLCHLDGKGLWHILQEAESVRLVCGVTHRLWRWLSDKPGVLLRRLRWRRVAGGWAAVSVLSTYSHTGHPSHPRPPQPRPPLAQSVKTQKPITAPTLPPLQGAGGVRLHSALTEHQVRVCVCARKAYSKTFYPPPAEREKKKHLHNISGAENFSAFINYTAATNVWRAETSRGPRRCGDRRSGEFQRGKKKNCDVINGYPHVWF